MTSYNTYTKQKPIKKTMLIFALGLMISTASACAMAPVETDPQKAAERNYYMREDCYKRGGVWYDDKGVCVGADVPK